MNKKKQRIIFLFIPYIMCIRVCFKQVGSIRYSFNFTLHWTHTRKKNFFSLPPPKTDKNQANPKQWINKTKLKCSFWINSENNKSKWLELKILFKVYAHLTIHEKCRFVACVKVLLRQRVIKLYLAHYREKTALFFFFSVKRTENRWLRIANGMLHWSGSCVCVSC